MTSVVAVKGTEGRQFQAVLCLHLKTFTVLP
jgi:hypothetical protein